MTSWVEISDPGAAEATASQLTALAGQLTNPEPPPEPVWGDDKFGTTMLERYPRDIVAECALQQGILRTSLTSAGTGVRAAVAELVAQDQSDAGGFQALSTSGE